MVEEKPLRKTMKVRGKDTAKAETVAKDSASENKAKTKEVNKDANQ